MGTCGPQREPTRAGRMESGATPPSCLEERGCQSPWSLYLSSTETRLGGEALSPSLPEENNRPVFLSSSCDPAGPHKEEEAGAKAGLVPRHSLGEGDLQSARSSSAASKPPAPQTPTI